MNKKYILALALGLSFAGANYAQGELDAYRLSSTDLKGTARAVSMGGAFGALGGDPTGVSINPGGLGVYTRSEAAVTLDFQNAKAKTNFQGNKEDANKFRFNIDNFSIVYSLPLYNDDVPFLNFSFAYNKIKSFDRNYRTGASNQRNSLVDYMANRAYGNHPNDLMSTSSYDPFAPGSGIDWLPALGASSHLIAANVDGAGAYTGTFGRNINLDNTLSSSRLDVREKGSINSYDFSLGTNISNMFSVGATVSVTDLDYKMRTGYVENFFDQGNPYAVAGYDLYNGLKTEGTGWQLKLGMIFKPINEIRVGVSYHSPTWYNMTDYFDTAMFPEMAGVDPGVVDENIIPYGDAVDYDFRTPDKWTFSLATVIAHRAILSVDYETSDYKNMKLKDGGYSYGDNAYIKRDFRRNSTIRAGVEFLVTPQFSVRGGYQWVQSPLKTSFKNQEVEAMTVGSIPNFTLEGDRHYVTGGLGYRFGNSESDGFISHLYVDLAFVLGTQKEDLYSFSSFLNENDNTWYKADKASLKTKRFQGLMTIGYRF